MKILLLRPKVLDQTKEGKPLSVDSFPAVGLNYLHSYLKYHKYNSTIFDFSFYEWDEIQSILIEQNADIVGITCLTEDRYNVFKLVHLIKKINKNTIIILGGHHPTYLADQLLNNFDIDYIVLREGEKRLLNLIKAIESSIFLEEVDGIAYKRDGIVIKNNENRINDSIELDSFPFPFEEDFMEAFHKYPSFKKVYPIEFKFIDPKHILDGKVSGCNIITSRGCPYNCQYCSASFFWGKQYRFRSPKNVVDEIEYYYKKYNFRIFKIADYSFTHIQERSIKICREIINRNLKINFVCQVRADRVHDELVFWLKKAGCISIGVGVESGSTKILKEINKKVNQSAIIKAFKIFSKHSLPAFPYLMVGNPGESDETIRMTITLLRIIKPYKVAVALTMVFPGTELYELSKKQGFINEDYWLTSKPQPYYTYENSYKTLKKWQFRILYYDKKKAQQNFLKILYIINGILIWLTNDRYFPLKKTLRNLKYKIIKILKLKDFTLR